METNIVEILEDGLIISLMDGSQWQLVNIGDISKTTIWYSPQRIQIDKNHNDEFFLVNLETYTPDKVKVSRVY